MIIRPIEFYKPITHYNGYFISDEGNVYSNLGKVIGGMEKALNYIN